MYIEMVLLGNFNILSIIGTQLTLKKTTGFDYNYSQMISEWLSELMRSNICIVFAAIFKRLRAEKCVKIILFSYFLIELNTHNIAFIFSLLFPMICRSTSTHCQQLLIFN